MAGHTMTRAQLTEAGLSGRSVCRATTSAELVESVIAEIPTRSSAARWSKISSFGSFAVRQKGQRIGRNPKTGQEVPISPPPCSRVPRLARAEASDQQRPQPAVGSARHEPRHRQSGRGEGGARVNVSEPGESTGARRVGKSDTAFPHDWRSRRRPRYSGACAALLGVQISSN